MMISAGDWMGIQWWFDGKFNYKKKGLIGVNIQKTMGSIKPFLVGI